MRRDVEGELRLVDGGGDRGGVYGRLELYANGVWGTVCGNGFGNNAADVACRQMNFARLVFCAAVPNAI